MKLLFSVPGHAAFAAARRTFASLAYGAGCAAFLPLLLAGTARAQTPCFADAGPAQITCSSTSVQIGAAPRTGYTYRWSPTTGLNNPSVANPLARLYNQAAGPVVRNYTVTVTGPAGCTATSTVAITVKPAPIANPGRDTTVCSGQVFTVGTPGIAGYTYQWPVGSAQLGLVINNPTLAQPTYTATNTSNAPFFRNVLLRVRSPGGCDTLVTLVVTVNPVPRANAGPDAAQCAGTPGTIGTPGLPGFTYSWSPITGLSNPADPQPTVTPTAAGSITYTLTATDNGCSATDQVVVTAYRSPAANAGPALAVCAGQPITLAAGSTPVPGTAYSWTPPTGLSNPNILNPTVTLPAVGAFTYTLTASTTAITACTATNSVVVTVTPAPTLTAITGPATICAFGRLQQYSAAIIPGFTYQWTVSGGTITVGQGTAQVTVQFAPGAMSYSVRAAPTTALGCAGPPFSIPVTVDIPTVALTVASVDEASNSRVNLSLTATSTTPVQVLRRVATIGGFAAAGTAPATATTFTDSGVDAAANAYEYRLDLTNACGEVLSSALAQTVRLEASSTAGTSSRDPGSVTLRWNAYVGFPVQEYRIYRSTDGGPARQVATVPANVGQVNVPNTGGFFQQFRVVAASTGTPALLANSNTASVTLANPLGFYNVITPNNDNSNELFIIDNITQYPGNVLRIFNRWGREIFNATNYQNNWGNTPDVASGVYFYQLQLPNGAPTTKGWVEVIR